LTEELPDQFSSLAEAASTGQNGRVFLGAVVQVPIRCAVSPFGTRLVLAGFRDCVSLVGKREGSGMVGRVQLTVPEQNP
jgi:hypothetical protein